MGSKQSVQKVMQTPLLFDGFVKPGFEKVKDAFRANFQSGVEKGGAFSIYYRGELVVNLWGGYSDKEVRRPWKEDTLSCYFSTTKSMSSVCIAQLVDKGLLDYNERVSRYWPEFAQNGKENVTLEQLISNQAGLSVLDEPFSMSLIRDDVSRLGQLLADQKPLWTPGKGHGYHPITFALYLDQVIRRVDPHNRSLGQYFQEEIAQPFGIEFYIGLPKPLHHRAPRVTLTKMFDVNKFALLFKGDLDILIKTSKNPVDFRNVKRMNDPDIRELPVGSVCGHGTAEAVAKFHGILANGGMWEGRQLLSPKAIQRLQKPLVGGIDKAFGLETMWSLGTQVLVAVEGSKPPMYMFGHGGYGGQFGLADPHYGVGLGYTTSHCNPDLAAGVEANLMTVYDAVYDCIHTLENVQESRQTLYLYPQYVKVTGSKL